ncbi:hypothetical protein XarbCFBP7408_08010 [Xanthomonas arboricola pv. guizotiae]|uniref:Uncharacterized protein n=1 Tax=Xanthomonas arboricola pv. guizotiae TaxID=487867 RepID=A0A2S6ZXB7_9XANT|nr:hypothetical protein XarbCFBP7409_14585 [Xanthomonas arboricola pv. guizotiae]PPU24549.1 hypothetical protein XarbCFBP7408_08010 [Xanthomonas arboricola pv. guizotiae]
MRRVPRWWAGKGPAADPQIVRCKPRQTHRPISQDPVPSQDDRERERNGDVFPSQPGRDAVCVSETRPASVP